MISRREAHGEKYTEGSAPESEQVESQIDLGHH